MRPEQQNLFFDCFFKIAATTTKLVFAVCNNVISTSFGLEAKATYYLKVNLFGNL